MGLTPEEIENTKSALENSPADPRYCSYAEYLIENSQSRDALDVCLKGLSIEPSNLEGRLMLARGFFELGYLEFAKRELEVIQQRVPKSEALKQLLGMLGKQAEAPATEDTEVAEVEIEF